MRTKSEETGLGGLISSLAVLDTLLVSVMSGDFPISATRMEVVSNFPVINHKHGDIITIFR